MAVRKQVIRYVTYDNREFADWESACTHEAKLWLKNELLNREWIDHVAEDLVRDADELSTLMIEYRRKKEQVER
jgi:hypothetical protein